MPPADERAAPASAPRKPHGKRKLADMAPPAPPSAVAPARALATMAATVACCGLVLSHFGARRGHRADEAVAGECAVPIERRRHGPQGPDHPPVSELLCAEALGPRAADLRPGDACVQGPDGGWQRHRGGMAAPFRLALALPLPLNQASAQDLALLGGLNPRQARAIVAHRQRHGPFPSVESLRQVHGIGKKTLAKVAPYLAVDDAAPAGADALDAPAPPLPPAPPPPGVGGQEEARGRPRWRTGADYAMALSVRRDWLVDLVARLPQASLSRAWGWLARRRRPKAFVWLYQRAFIRAVGIDMDEAALPLSAYPSLQDLFVRQLRPGLRPIDAAPDAIVSPVDARVGHFGVVENGTMFQVKGRSYSLARLLGDEARARQFEGGPYATFYLAPRDYHRIHAPVAGEVREAKLIPGSLFPVFEESLHKVDELFARNERIISYLSSPQAGEVAVIKVAATLVGCITTAFDPTLRGNVAGETIRTRRYSTPPQFDRGQELGAFELGSTVVLIGERGRFAFGGMDFGQVVHMGQRVGSTDMTRVTAAPGQNAGGAPVRVPSGK